MLHLRNRREQLEIYWCTKKGCGAIAPHVTYGMLGCKSTVLLSYICLFPASLWLSKYLCFTHTIPSPGTHLSINLSFPILNCESLPYPCVLPFLFPLSFIFISIFLCHPTFLHCDFLPVDCFSCINAQTNERAESPLGPKTLWIQICIGDSGMDVPRFM